MLLITYSTSRNSARAKMHLLTEDKVLNVTSVSLADPLRTSFVLMHYIKHLITQK